MSDYDNKSRSESGAHQGWWQKSFRRAADAARRARQSPRWRWMLPWTLAAIGMAVTIAWILQPSPQPQFGVRQGRVAGRGPGGGGFGPGGLGPGGIRPGGGGRAGAVADASKRGNGPPAEGTAVGAAVAATGDIALVLNALGTVTPAAVVTVRPQISGQLQQVAFKEGQIVHEGDFLAQIDPRNYELQLKQAEGNLARDKVLLGNAQRDLVRYQTLLEQNAASPQQVDTQKASVAQYTAAVSTDEVQIGTAKLNLTYCHILAPISGRIGLRQVDPGNYVTTGETNGLAVITQLSPITALFTVPEDTLPQIQARMRAGAQLDATAYDRTNTAKLADGRLASLDNLIDVSTGTLRLRAMFPNEDGSLFPNQFVNIRLLVDTVHNATVLPPSAVQHGAPGAFVFLIKQDDTVTIQPVKTGASNATMVQILTGVKPGDQVVIDGVDRMREGTLVYVPNPPTDATKPVAEKAAAEQPGETPLSTDTDPATNPDPRQPGQRRPRGTFNRDPNNPNAARAPGAGRRPRGDGAAPPPGGPPAGAPPAPPPAGTPPAG